MRIVTVAQAAELDQKAMQDHGISGIDLMGAAGKAIAEEVKKMAAEIPGSPSFVEREIMAGMALPQLLV